MSVLEEIKETLMAGNANKVRETVTKAVEEGLSPSTIIKRRPDCRHEYHRRQVQEQ